MPPSDIPVLLLISFTNDPPPSFSTAFMAAVFALVTDVLGLPGWISLLSLTDSVQALKDLNHLITLCMEMQLGPYISHNFFFKDLL